MAWEISISNEGWDDIYNTLHETDKAELIEAIATHRWELAEQAHNEAESLAFENDQEIEPFDSVAAEKDYEETKKTLASLAHDTLADIVFQQIQDVGTCDNGGNGYWMDASGWNRLYVSE